MLAVAILAVGFGTTLWGAAPGAQAAVVPGSQADLQVTVSGPTRALAGDPFSYIVVMSNNSLADADGATFSDELSVSFIAKEATCTASGGAECPSTLAVGPTGVSGTVGALPHLGTVTVTVTGAFRTVSTVTNTARIDPPAGVIDPDTSTNTSIVNTSVSAVADGSVTLSTDATSLTYGSVARYTAVFTNAGPQPADYSFVSASSFQDVSNGVLRSSTTDQTCSTTGEAVCPDNGSLPGSAQVATLPANSSLTFTWAVEFTRDSSCNSSRAPSYTVTAKIEVQGGADLNPRNDNAGVRTPFVVDDCKVADLAVTKVADAATLEPGGSLGYTLTFTNNGPDDATDVPIRDTADLEDATDAMFSTHDYSGLTCTTTGGAICPDVPAAASAISVGASTFTSAIPSLPSGSSVVIQYTDTFRVGTASCSPVQRQFLNNSVAVNAPANITDPSTADNAVVTRTRVIEPVCAPSDVAVTTTTTNATVTFPGTDSYTVTVTNNGPNAADGTRLTSALRIPNAANPFQPSGFTGRYDYSDLDCVAQGGAVCPMIPSSRTGVSLGSTTFDTTIPALPSGSSVTVTFAIALGQLNETRGDTSGSVENSVQVSVPPSNYDPNPQNNTARAASAFSFARIAVNNMVSTTSARTGDTIVYNVQVSNAGDGTADDVLFIDEISPVMRFVSAQCTPSTGAPVCGEVTYDAASGTVRSTIVSLARAEALTFTLVATAGPTTSTATNIATATPSPSSTYFDINPDANISRVNVQIFDTLSPVTVTKRIDGLAASGLPAAATFTGRITCEQQPAQSWSVTVPAGSSAASAPDILIYDGDTCTVSEDAPPAPPAGLLWSPSVIVTPSTFRASSATPVAVSVVNTLLPAPPTTASVVVTKRIDGLDALGLPTAATFTGSISCTMRLAQSWSVTVPAGSSTAAAPAVPVADGDVCTVTEDAPPAAPAGLAWSPAAAISPATFTVRAPTQVDVTVTNTLVRPAPQLAQVTVTKRIDGLAAVGATGPLTFTGAVTCAAADSSVSSVAWGVTVAAGETSATTQPFTVPAGTRCVASEDIPPAAPSGSRWIAVNADAGTTGVLAPDSTTDIPVLNRLASDAPPAPSTGALVIAVSITGGPSDAAGTFSFTMVCGRNTSLATVRVDAGETGVTTLPSLPAGTDCSVRETSKSAAPVGYEWGATVIAQPTVQIVAGATATVQVVYALALASGPSNGGPTPTPDTTPTSTPEATPTPTPEATPTDGATETPITIASGPAFPAGRPSADASTTLAYTGGQVSFPFIPLGVALITAGVIALFLIRRRRQSADNRR